MYKRPVNIIRIKKGEIIEMQDTVLIEQAVDLSVDSKSLSNIICLPSDLKELAIGFLFSIGIIDSINDIKDITINEMDYTINIELIDSEKFNPEVLNMSPVSRVIDTTCGIPSPWRNLIKKTLNDSKDKVNKKDDVRIKAELIYSSIKGMQDNTRLFRETGGCHGAALFNFKGELIACKEDIGRHNAIDKILGEALIKKLDLKQVILTSTGRLTGDTVLKAVRAKIPIVASLATAIESGIRLAFAHGTTLIGFVRGARMNIYTHSYRIEV